MSARRWLFRLHGWLGISIGLVLAVVGATGATMAFQDEIMTALSPGIVTVAAPPGNARPASGTADARRLPPDALVAAVSAQRRGARVTQLVIEGDPGRAPRVTFAPATGKRRGEQSYINPVDGRLLGPARGEAFFRTVEDVHRWLALPGGAGGAGRWVTAAAAIALLFFAMSGLYLRWPRRPLDWRAWLVLDLRRGGRDLYRALHRTIGAWVLVFYLFSALTGLWWSFDWYQHALRLALTGCAAPPGRERVAAVGPTIALAPAWRAFLATEAGRFERATIAPPDAAGQVVIRELTWDRRFDRMTDERRFDAATGRPSRADLYDRRGTGDAIAGAFHQFHTGAFFGMAGRIALFLAAATLPMFTVTGLLLYQGRRSGRRRGKRVAAERKGWARRSGEEPGRRKDAPRV